MRERPILFSAPMVRAILDGRKTQTRRVVKEPAEFEEEGRTCRVRIGKYFHVGSTSYLLEKLVEFGCPYGVVGDQLWVRESYWMYGRWRHDGHTKTGRDRWRFESVGQRVRFDKPLPHELTYWGSEYDGYTGRPSIHMPRWASRITLTVTDVRVQRLQDISEADAKAEGVEASGWTPSFANPDNAGCADSLSAVDEFAELWDSINGKRAPWSANPWVWAITFAVVKRTPTREGGV